MSKAPGWVYTGKVAALLLIITHGITHAPFALAAPTITTVDSTGSTGYYPSIAIGSDNLPIVSYYDLSNDLLKVAHCGNNTCTSGNTITVIGSAGTNTSITIGADNLPIISYYDSVFQELKVAHCGNVSCSSGNTLVTVESGGVGNSNSITIGSDNLPIISYSDDVGLDMKIAHCGNNTCSTGNTITTIDTTNRLWFYNDIAIGNDGLPIVSYPDHDTFSLKVTHCGNNTCTSGNTTTTVDSGGSLQAYYTSIAIGSDNLAIISYSDSTSGTLKTIHCGNAACTSGNAVVTVDNSGNIANVTSIARGTDGMPVISYYDSVNSDLKVAHCGDSTCSTGNTLTTVDATGSVGSDSSITIASDTFPSIAYRDFTNGDLKYAHCDNYLCDLSGGGGSNDAPFFSPWSLALLGVGIFVYLKREQLLLLHD